MIINGFGKPSNPFFQIKELILKKLILIENDVILTKETDISKIMNNYFVNITEGLELKHDVLNNFNVDLTEITET